MSHTLLVEAMETEFIPVVIHNNKGGKDAEILKRFKEPSWNNPVVRFVDAKGRDLITRKDGIWDTHGIAARMIAALKAAKQPVPGYLELTELETRTSGIQTATFAMSCFWEGESRIGGLAGVTGTRAGWLDGREVVEVQFDPKSISYTDLLGNARKMNCLNRAFAHSDSQLKAATSVLGGSLTKRTDERARDAKDSDQLYYLRRSKLMKLGLSKLQKVRVNAALRAGADGHRWLSPRQKIAAASM